MKSAKQRRAEIDAARSEKVEAARQEKRRALAAQGILVDAASLAPSNSYGTPDFVERGYYVERPFVCKDCGVAEVWTARQQKWWYEVAKGDVYSVAVRCRACRKKEQARKREARRSHLAGLRRTGQATTKQQGDPGRAKPD